jgi:hypothetical protein
MQLHTLATPINPSVTKQCLIMPTYLSGFISCEEQRRQLAIASILVDMSIFTVNVCLGRKQYNLV